MGVGDVVGDVGEAIFDQTPLGQAIGGRSQEALNEKAGLRKGALGLPGIPGRAHFVPITEQAPASGDAALEREPPSGTP